MKPHQTHWIPSSLRRTHPALAVASLAVALFLSATGCQRHNPGAADLNPAGDYTLVSVGGNRVPCEVRHDGGTLTVDSGTFLISADGTCVSRVSFKTPGGQNADRTVKARYTRKGSTLIMNWDGAGTTTGTVTGQIFMMDNEGLLFVYRR